MIDMAKLFRDLSVKINQITQERLPTSDRLNRICRILKEMIPNYDWVGFYMVNPEDKRELILGPFAGAPTEHIRIPFGRGICGQAAETKRTFIVADVSSETNYLSCNPSVKSEIVVPIFKNNEIIGELDIDSHTAGIFNKEDETFLGEICKMVSKIL